MKEYTLVLSTYSVRQTVKVQLKKSEVKLMNDITKSLSKQKASIMLEVAPNVLGMPVFESPDVPDDTIRFDHPDGRVDKVKIS